MQIDELLFCCHRVLFLRAGSNFDDGMKKTTGGRNGYGAKLANIFSTRCALSGPGH